MRARATRNVAGWAFASLADVAKGGDGAESALREIFVFGCGYAALCSLRVRGEFTSTTGSVPGSSAGRTPYQRSPRLQDGSVRS
jgi:hypothetical protein